jgi:hypothetical protein
MIFGSVEKVSDCEDDKEGSPTIELLEDAETEVMKVDGIELVELLNTARGVSLAKVNTTEHTKSYQI